MAFIPIQYRGFYDMPRAFVAEHGGSLFLFDCSFDDSADEYSERYKIYRLHISPDQLPKGSWDSLPTQGTFIAELATNVLKFDKTRRSFVDDSVFELIQIV